MNERLEFCQSVDGAVVVTQILLETILEKYQENNKFKKLRTDKRPRIAIPDILHNYMHGKSMIIPKDDLDYWYAGPYCTAGPGSEGVKKYQGRPKGSLRDHFLILSVNKFFEKNPKLRKIFQILSFAKVVLNDLSGLGMKIGNLNSTSYARNRTKKIFLMRLKTKLIFEHIKDPNITKNSF